MNEFRALAIRGLVFPVLLGSAQSAITIPAEQSFIESNTRLLIAQAAEPIAEMDARFGGIESGSVQTLVTTEGNTTQIEGGIQAGSNLFHRFDKSGIGVGETADFVTPEATQAVFGQVAGGGASYINGRLQVSGSDADLYLINPAGVLFGPDAQLNLGGSLTVTTADQVGFGEAWLDLAAAAESKLDYANLTGTPDAYRFTTQRPGAVVNQANLAVGKGQALRLVGGNVVNTGRLSAAGGEVTLTAVGEKAHAPTDEFVDELVDESAQRLVRLGSQGALLSVEVAGATVENGAWNPLSVPELLTGANAGSGVDDLRVNEDGSVDLLAAGAAVSAVDAGDFGGLVVSAGEVDVSGTVGGEINLFGREVNAIAGQLTASGEFGGGLIQVGGGYQGKGHLPTAERVLFGERAIALQAGGTSLINRTTLDTDYAALFRVKVTDTLGAALSGIQVDFTLPTSGASGVINAGASTLITDINGMAALAAKAGQVAGGYTLLAQTADGLASSSTTVTNRADVASNFSVSGPPSPLIAGEPVSFSVTALDRFNNVADSYNNMVSFSSSDGRALLPGNSTLINGIGSFNATPITAGVQTLTVADSAAPTLTTDIGNISVTAAAAEVLTIVAGRGQIATVGSTFAQGLTVQVSDRFGNPVVGEPVAFSVPNAGASGVLDSGLVLTDSAGLATARVQANDVAGSYRAIASVAGVSGLFGLENEAIALIPPVDPVPVDSAPVDPVVVDLVPVDPTAINLVPEGLTFAQVLALLSDGTVPLEGTTQAGSSSDLLDEAQPQNEQSLSGRGGVFDEVAFAETERLLTDEYAKYWRTPMGSASALDSIQKILQRAETHHKARSAVVYALFVPPGKRDRSDLYPSVLSQRLLRDETKQDLDQLLLVMVPPEGQPVQRLMDVSRSEIVRQAQLLGIEISLIEESGYQPLARQLYNWLLAPIEPDLQQNGIDNLMYVLDEGLRTMPLAAMMTGDRFAIEQYGISMLPSMGLLNADFDTAPAEQTVLTAGADRFETLDALPAVPVELGLVGAASASSQMLFNEAFSLSSLMKAQARSPKTMMHLATHAAFNPGALERSYVQLWNEQLTLNEISALDLDGLEMLILSACATAMGSREAELGFAGLAAATGVEASIGSLWNVSDVGTMALMAEFYEQLRRDPLRFGALQQAQLSLLRGETRLENNKLITQNGQSVLPDGFVGEESMTFSHPFFWSGFTLIGSPWW